MRLIRALFAAACLALPSSAVGGGQPGTATPFGSVGIPIASLPALHLAGPALAEIASRIVDPSPVAGSATSIRDVMERVNRHVNRSIIYVADQDAHGVPDHWALPSETLAMGRGDCEDYALLKMALLAASGVEAVDMSLVVVRDGRRGAFHAVVAVHVRETFYILDNVTDAVLRDTQIPHYQPVLLLSDGRGFLLGQRVVLRGENT